MRRANCRSKTKEKGGRKTAGVRVWRQEKKGRRAAGFAPRMGVRAREERTSANRPPHFFAGPGDLFARAGHVISRRQRADFMATVRPPSQHSVIQLGT